MLKYSLYNTFSRLITFVLSAFFYSVLFLRLDADEFATFGQLSIGFGFLSLVDFGSNLLITKTIDKETGGEKLRAVECFYLFISVCIFFLLFLAKEINNNPSHKWKYFLDHIYLIYTILIFKFYQLLYLSALLGLREVRSHLIISILYSLFSTILVLFFLEIFGYNLYVLLSSLTLVSGVLIIISVVLVWSKLNHPFFIAPYWKFYVINRKFNQYISLNSILGVLLSNFDKYFVLAYLTLEQLSLYTLVSKIVSPINVVYTSFGQGLLSPLSELWTKGFKKEFYLKAITSSRILLIILQILIISVLIFSKYYFDYLKLSQNEIDFSLSLCCLLILSSWFNAIATTLIYSSISLGDSKSQFLMNLIVGPCIIILFWIFQDYSVFSVFYLMVLQNIAYIFVYLQLIRSRDDFNYCKSYSQIILTNSLVAVLIILYFWYFTTKISIDIIVFILLSIVLLLKLPWSDYLKNLRLS